MPLPFTPPLFERFADVIMSLPPLSEYGAERLRKYGPEHLCTPTFRLYSDGSIELFYAPFDFVNKSAKVVLVGITPGFQKMEIGYRTARAALVKGKTGAEACRQAEAEASFDGVLSWNLVSMLADIDIHRWVGMSSHALLIDGDLSLLHPTSAIRYPVFVHGANYTRHTPPPRPLRHPLLRRMLFDVLSPELAEVPGALIIPLGKRVENCLSALISAGLLSGERCLLGFPHPSPLNGHRKEQFELNLDWLKKKTARWFKKTAGA